MNDIKYPLGNELLPGSILRITTNVSKVLNTIKSKINSLISSINTKKGLLAGQPSAGVDTPESLRDKYSY